MSTRIRQLLRKELCDLDLHYIIRLFFLNIKAQYGTPNIYGYAYNPFSGTVCEVTRVVVNEFLECTVAANQGSSSSKNPGKFSC